ncbi:hypothetical protein A5320_20075 [Rheinheimera sp. SA_1]|uniref:PilW family protein n=1 Tax=Rheinheimera sp. SA_1 TaxID=1827365 RepID=UPI0007FB8FDB|nr:type II secretion system protein [Rheinheimera sp. SA_1]OBP13144.1 hypothetical protein A5320_20075 [Rheinheimera sp. SA_1]
MPQIQATHGFTLVELMVTLLLSSLIMVGMGGAMIAIKHTVNEVNALENAQEVLRSSRDMLNNSVRKGTVISLTGNTLRIEQLNSSSSQMGCSGTTQALAFVEEFRFDSSELQCRINGGNWISLVTGLIALDFSINGDLLTTRLAPRGLPLNYPQADLNGDASNEPYVRLQIALKSVILARET